MTSGANVANNYSGSPNQLPMSLSLQHLHPYVPSRWVIFKLCIIFKLLTLHYTETCLNKIDGICSPFFFLNKCLPLLPQVLTYTISHCLKTISYSAKQFVHTSQIFSLLIFQHVNNTRVLHLKIKIYFKRHCKNMGWSSRLTATRHNSSWPLRPSMTWLPLCLKISVSNHPAIKCINPEVMPQLHHCKNLKLHCDSFRTDRNIATNSEGQFQLIYYKTIRIPKLRNCPQGSDINWLITQVMRTGDKSTILLLCNYLYLIKSHNHMTPIHACTLFYIENGNENMMLFPTSKTMQENLQTVLWVCLVFQQSQYKQARISPSYPHSG